MIVWGPLWFVGLCLGIWFILHCIGEATSRRCPACKGVVATGAVKCMHCASDLPPAFVKAQAVRRYNPTLTTRAIVLVTLAIVGGAGAAVVISNWLDL